MVGIANVNRIINSRRDRSSATSLFKAEVNLPNAIRLNSQIEQAALNTIEEAAITVARGFWIYEPDNDKNSPIQFTEIPGVPILARVKIKKYNIAIGI